MPDAARQQNTNAEPANSATNIRQVKQAGKKNSNPLTEYVSAGGPYWYANSLASLPHPIDDVTLDFGDDLWDRVLNDAQMAALVNTFKTGILEDGLTFSPSVADEDENHAAAAELADWCTWVFDRLKIPTDEMLWDMTDAVPYGNRVAELVYEHLPGPDGTTQLLLTKIAPKPRRMTAFVVDGFNNLVGLLGQIPGQSFYVQTGMIVDPGELDNFLDREHFAVLTFRSKNGDPRGQSLCRPAYDAWYVKQQIKVEYLKYLAQFASPLLLGFTAADVDDDPEFDEEGNPLPQVSPETAMATTLATARNSTALAFPNTARVDVTKSEGNGEAHLLGIDLQNREMAKALTSQTLATEEGKHQARASSDTHENRLDTIIRQAKRIVERMIVRDVLTPLIRWNFGEKALALMPKANLGKTEQHDFSAMATAISMLCRAGYLHNSQLPFIDVMLGLPVRDLTQEDAVAGVAGIQPPQDAQDSQDAEPGSKPAMPMDPEQEAARVIGLVARADVLRRAQARAAARQPIVGWTGATLRSWLEEVA
jgi:hypothetical protein